MKRSLLLSIVVLFSLHSNAQSDSLKWTREINDQVWKPFIAHFISGNTEGFKAVHSKRVSRVEIDQGVLKDYDKYFPPSNPNSQTVKRNGERSFELRFDKRISNGTRAWETGYYKGTFTAPGKEPRSWYGRFFVVLEKEDNVWKIIVDADTGKTANEENFIKALPME